ncbi:hypothetical protein [Rossellomorea marisflavi]|uniref:hypothetical protein n=1 Tax=Rossellomorea marisflavi TaxID=189381 RepID=UPI00295E992A|nr:hypothetical protein [Rossellomorea marisflavi]
MMLTTGTFILTALISCCLSSVISLPFYVRTGRKWFALFIAFALHALIMASVILILHSDSSKQIERFLDTAFLLAFLPFALTYVNYVLIERAGKKNVPSS